MRFLVAESEPAEDRAKRRASVGRSSGETYVDVLRELVPGVECTRIVPADSDADVLDAATLAGFDAVFLTGSPLHLYDDTPEVRREVAFMRAVFASGTPAFGSCAGLQVATVAAGGAVRPIAGPHEAGFARRIVPTAAGQDHPLLRGRPAAFDAPAIHSDEVERLPDGAVVLAGNAVTAVQAAEIRHDNGVFWGVQYHPELSLGEVAAALRRQGDDLVAAGLATDGDDVEAVAALVDVLAGDPAHRGAAWRLGIDAQVTDTRRRRTEIVNFIDALVKPRRAERGR